MISMTFNKCAKSERKTHQKQVMILLKRSQIMFLINAYIFLCTYSKIQSNMNLIKYLFSKKKNCYKFMINFRKIFFCTKSSI